MKQFRNLLGVLSFSLLCSVPMASAQVPGFTETESVLARLQAARCNLLNGHETTACFQLGKLSDEISRGNRAEIAPVFSFCYYGGIASNTAYKIEMFLRASGVLPDSCKQIQN